MGITIFSTGPKGSDTPVVITLKPSQVCEKCDTQSWRLTNGLCDGCL